MDSSQPTPELDELKAAVAELREKVDAIEGALNAFVVVYRIHRLPPPGEDL